MSAMVDRFHDAYHDKAPDYANCPHCQDGVEQEAIVVGDRLEFTQFFASGASTITFCGTVAALGSDERWKARGHRDDEYYILWDDDREHDWNIVSFDSPDRYEKWAKIGPDHPAKALT